VLIIVLENQDYSKVNAAEYFNSYLPSHGTVFTHFLGNYHDSYPNYLAMVGGDYFGTDNDRQENLSKDYRTVAHLLDARGLSWAQYAEDYEPTHDGKCDITRGEHTPDDHYVRRHVPFLSFESITSDPRFCTRILRAPPKLPAKNLPAYAFYSPNLCNDGHGDFVHTCVGEPNLLGMAENWLKSFLNPILEDQDAMKGTLIVLTFDESEGHNDNHIYTAFLGDMVRKGYQPDDRCYDHYNVLRTIEDNFGLGTLHRKDEKSDPIVSVFLKEPEPQK
jgi:acid phosphatase